MVVFTSRTDLLLLRTVKPCVQKMLIVSGASCNESSELIPSIVQATKPVVTQVNLATEFTGIV